MVEKPKLDSNSKVIGWDVSWSPQRPFALGKKNAFKNQNYFTLNKYKKNRVYWIEYYAQIDIILLFLSRYGRFFR